MSLSFENKELEAIEPWYGVRKGRQIYIDTFSNVDTYWEVKDFQSLSCLMKVKMSLYWSVYLYVNRSRL